MLDLLQHYFGVNSRYLKYSSSVIPVSRHWDPENLILNEYIRLLYNKNWIPVGFVAPLKERTGSY
nr:MULTISPECIES: WPE palindromic element domain-containing protein [unclassified Wolbachia]